jgi:DNA-binding transcriptional ArsR family regulator
MPITLRHMVNRLDQLDRVFQALADPSRRAMVERLVGGPASVSQLAEPLPMSLPAVVQHLGVLESAGIVSTEKVGRVRTCRLEHEVMRRAEGWFGAQRTVWEARLDRLEIELAKPSLQPQPRPTGLEQEEKDK